MQKWASSILATHLLQTEAEITTTAADPYSEKYLRCIPRSSSRVWGRLENVYRYLCGLKTRAPPSETVHHLCDYPQRLYKRGALLSRTASFRSLYSNPPSYARPKSADSQPPNLTFKLTHLRRTFQISIFFIKPCLRPPRWKPIATIPYSVVITDSFYVALNRCQKYRYLRCIFFFLYLNSYRAALQRGDSKDPNP